MIRHFWTRLSPASQLFAQIFGGALAGILLVAFMFALIVLPTMAVAK